MSQVQAWKRSKDRWSPEETNVLIQAWAPRYSCRRQGRNDASVLLHIRGRARSSRALVTEDWRAVALAVNLYRTTTARPRLDSCRTHYRCKKRVQYLKKQYLMGHAARLGWPFLSVLDAALADEVGDRGAGGVEGRGAPAGDAGGTVAAGAYDGAAEDEGGSAAGNADSGAAAVDDRRGIAMVDARASAAAAVAEEEAFVLAGGTASVAARRGALVDEDCRAVAIAVKSCHASNGISSEYKQCRERVKLLSHVYEKKHDAVFGAAVGEERGGASVDGRGAAAEAARRRATSVPPIPKRPRSAKSAEALAAGSADAVVIMKLAEKVTKLAGIYKELRMKVLDVEREKAAAAHTGAGPRA